MGLYPLRQIIRLPGKQFATPVAEFVSFLGVAESTQILYGLSAIRRLAHAFRAADSSLVG